MSDPYLGVLLHEMLSVEVTRTLAAGSLVAIAMPRFARHILVTLLPTKVRIIGVGVYLR